VSLRRDTVGTIAVFGGSFDPPHVSHVLCIAYVLSAEGVDSVLVVPTFEHALGKEAGASFEHRFAMMELATRDLHRVHLSRMEATRGGTSRTLDTLEALTETHPGASFRLLIGADILGETSRWHRWDRITEIAPPIVVGRGGYDAPRPDTVTLPEVSSTDLRQRLAERRSVAGLVPVSVEAYIREHALYEVRA
jgi:nicotinate-nucleotide adenylyltransferase